MKIISLQAENVKKLVAITITPDGNMVEITGRNGQGKTSVLDSIWWALAGAGNIQAQPIRKGEKTARIRLNLGELVVERRFTEKGGALVVENADGARFPSPQKMLDELIGALSFDPLAFARMEPKKQVSELRRISKMELDFDALDGLNRADYEKRRDINRQANEKSAQAEGIVLPADLPPAPVDDRAILDRIEQASEANAAIERDRAARQKKRDEADQAFEAAEDFRADATRKRDEAARLLEDATALDARAAATDERRAAMLAELEKLLPLAEPVSVTELRASLEAAQAINADIARRVRRDTLKKEAADLADQAKALTDQMDAREATKQNAIAAAQMPVDGLGFGDGVVTFGGIPFEQCSSAEQLRVSLAIAMAGNPKLRVIRIQDGSLLDEDSLKQIAAMAEANDYQVWIERVDTSGKVGFIIEDGHARRAGEEVAEPQKGAA